MEICLEKCASMHWFLCILFISPTAHAAGPRIAERDYALEWKSMSRLDRPGGSDVLETKGGQTNRLPLSKFRY